MQSIFFSEDKEIVSMVMSLLPQTQRLTSTFKKCIKAPNTV